MLNRSPFSLRNEIPFFYNKTETEFQQDPYEQYSPMVIRQSALHLFDEFWNGYPLQPVVDLSLKVLQNQNPHSILELGCGVGRWVAGLAERFPNATCWGIDYSYQMLKQAHRVWKTTETTQLNLSKYGFSSINTVQGKKINNLHFALAKADQLPFEGNSFSTVISSFLLDRLDDPKAGLQEIFRILKKGGYTIIVTPLNFQHPRLWELYYPPIKLYQLINESNFEIVDWQEDLNIQEPLDKRGNHVSWKCLAMVLRKK